MKLEELGEKIGYETEIILVVTKEGIANSLQKRGFQVPPEQKELFTDMHILQLQHGMVGSYKEMGLKIQKISNCVIV